MSESTKEKLFLREIGKSQAEQFDVLYARFHCYVQATADRLLQSPEMAADVAQETWLRVWRRLPGQEYVSGIWLGVIVMHVAFDFLRKEKLRAGHEVSLPEHAPSPWNELEYSNLWGVFLRTLADGGGRTPEEVIERTLATEQLHYLLTVLTPAQRRVIVLAGLGFSPAEIAARIGDDVAAVYRLRNNARDRLTRHGFLPHTRHIHGSRGHHAAGSYTREEVAG